MNASTLPAMPQGFPVNLRDAVSIINNEPRTTSLKVAEVFGRLHKNILQRIESLDCSPEFTSANFSAHVENQAVGTARRDMKYYEMTKDGFMFLVMGFTGKQAAAIKEAYINAFNWMAAELQKVGRRRSVADVYGEPSLSDGKALRLIEEDMQALYSNVGIFRARANRLISSFICQLQEPVPESIGERGVHISRADWLGLQIALDTMQLKLSTWFALLQDDVSMVSEQHLPALRQEVAAIHLLLGQPDSKSSPTARLLLQQYGSLWERRS